MRADLVAPGERTNERLIQVVDRFFCQVGCEHRRGNQEFAGDDAGFKLNRSNIPGCLLQSQWKGEGTINMNAGMMAQLNMSQFVSDGKTLPVFFVQRIDANNWLAA